MEFRVRMQGLEATQPFPFPAFVLLPSYFGAGKVKCTTEKTLGMSLKEVKRKQHENEDIKSGNRSTDTLVPSGLTCLSAET